MYKFVTKQREVKAIQYKKNNLQEIVDWFSSINIEIENTKQSVDNFYLEFYNNNKNYIIKLKEFIVYEHGTINIYTDLDFYKNFIPLKRQKELNVIDSEDKSKVSDIEVFGNPDLFQLICKASSKSQNWMESTKACEVKGFGCIVQVTTQQGDNVSEALTFVPKVRIEKDVNGNKYFKEI